MKFRNRSTPPASHRRALRGSLFDRLIADEEDFDLPAGINVERAQIASIRRNLGSILNLRAGSAAANPALGIIDMNDGAVRSNDMIRQIGESIRHCIAMGEPRIHDVKVAYIAASEPSLSLRFRIVAQIGRGSTNQSTEFQLFIDDNRRCIVR